MATGPITSLEDVIVPEIFTPYAQQTTEEKSRLIQSGAVVRDSSIDDLLAGGGATFNMPSMKDLDNEEENISTDDADDEFTGGSNNSTPKKTGTSREVGVRLSRNQSWSSSDLAASLAGIDPMDSIAQKVGGYWARRLQAAFVATMKGVFADNAAAPDASEHVLNDMTNDLSTLNSGVYQAGLTDFSSAAFLDAAVTMGDSMEDLGLIMVHSIVYNRMQKNNLIEFIPDARGETTIPTYLGRTVIVDDSMPFSSGLFETWLFGAGAIRLGMGTPKVPTETERKAASGNGGGSEILYNRVEWCLHPAGHRFTVTPEDGGPSNAATTGNLAHLDSWRRAFPERKQIKIARLITREM
ncbi:capsid protein [Alteromonas phage vB_AcoS-R7M]|uniref:Capsid protein n=1 Tax=Alteromonas phage vB_AcoS-R7M TaxID=2729541 RepID=A0A6M3YP61_9CAUD|nr:major head protein [Alteromonas phage vB_AcoS-R7M]QJI53348.1 capsid protein [Alteromonas phage vB_AcoS-R7M]